MDELALDELSIYDFFFLNKIFDDAVLIHHQGRMKSKQVGLVQI